VVGGASRFGEPGVIVLFDSSPAKLGRAAAGFGWDIAALEAHDLVRVIFTTREIFVGEVHQPDSLLLEETRSIGARRLFIDGLVPTAFGSAESIRDGLQSLAAVLQQEGLTTMIALDVPAEGTSRPASVTAAELVGDTMLSLRLASDRGPVERSLEITKSRGRVCDLGRHAMHIVPGQGVEIYPRIHTARPRAAAAGYDPSTRLTTGVPGLDDLVNGGVFLASATLLTGLAGTGKSLVGLQFLVEGARRGERGLLLSIEEPPAQVVANAAAIGIDMQPLLDRDLLRLWCPDPDDFPVEPCFHRLEEAIHGYQPRRLVVDSVSAYAATFDVELRELRDLLRSAIGLLKADRVTSLHIVESHGLNGMGRILGQLAPSSLFDNVIKLARPGRRQPAPLALEVVKLRGNPVPSGPQPCEVVPGVGVQVKRGAPSAAA
jgi:circadian clock protein KaiC